MGTPRRLLRSDESGQSLIEFALVLPLLLLIITGLFDVARATWQENTLAYAAREGTRYAIVHGSASLDGTIVHPGYDQPVVDAVRNAAVGVPNVSVVVQWIDSGCYDRNCRVQVDSTAPFVPIPSQYLLGGVFQITLRGGSLLVIQR
ncbi:MAG TPA: TadE family protein [Candidatus Limnocylindria bacterium]|nr:TadE family protein [Candidatus Limnocylindria bacterium]